MNPPADLIEDALHTYPLADLPTGFSKTVMEQVRASQTPIRFRLTWMDYALGLLFSLLTGVGFLVWISLPRQVFLRLQFQWSLFQQPRVEILLLVSLAAAGALLFVSLLVGVRLLSQPRMRLA
jgi:hypothetical protein